MAMSLEDLLEEEGFKGRRSKTISRASSGFISARIPTYPARNELKPGASVRLKKTERAYSDANRYDLSVESTLTDRGKGRRSVDVAGRRSVDVAKREKNVRRSTNDTRERHNRSGSQDIGSSIETSKQFSFDEIVESKEGVGGVKNGVQDKRKQKDVYLNGVKQPVLSSSRSSISTQNRGDSRYSRARESVDIEQPVAELALDKLAIKAIISILSDHTKRIIKDQDFRISLRHNCLAMLNFTELEENLISEGKVVSSLKQAIETAERATEENVDAKVLKKAALQLSVITGLNINGLKDGFTSGISNSMLSACGHLYLSVIYQLQKKELVAARHLLQVFCDSPLSARMTLVPELWDHIFHPHLMHLEQWYKQEVDSMGDDPSNIKLKKLKKLYEEIVDDGTYQFALYYKDWLTDGVEAPSIPSIHVPSVSFQGISQEGILGRALDFSSPVNAFLPQHNMVCKKLNGFECMCKSAAAAEVEDHHSAQRADDGRHSYDGGLVEDKMTVTHCLEENKHDDLVFKQYGESNEQDGLVAQEALELHRANALGKFRNAIMWPEGLRSTNTLQALPIAKVNELTLNMLAKSVFELQQTEKTACLPHCNDAPDPDFLQIKTRTMGEGWEIKTTLRNLHEKHIGGGRGLFLCVIPQDYLCPLTGFLFKDPVTLENGQTYERVAIAEWFSKGNKTCPVTREMLECHNVPHTNLILNRVIDRWKADHSRNILASACQVAGSSWEQKFKDEAAIFILEQLLTRKIQEFAKHLMALGGLRFLIRRFKYGDLDEKTCAAALLSRCIKADSGCRINVAETIEKRCLLDLLNCKGVKSRTNAVMLLFELVCLNRRKDVRFFLGGLQKGDITSSMQILLVFLQGCSPEQKPLVAVLLLHLDLMVDQQKHSIYREQAVDTITSALDTSFSDEKVQVACCRALLILGGHISISGKVMTEDWNLKKAGFLDGPELEVQEDGVAVKDNILPELKEEEEAVREWLMMLSTSLLGDGKKSFLDSLSRCLSSGHRDMRRVCLTTMAWLSSALTSLANSQFQLSAFSIVINQLKENLKAGEGVEHRILATMSLLNFSKIPECRDLLMTIAVKIAEPLRDLCEVTWMAKELYALISQQDS
ncbi:hypothetical protein OSB04_021763 [Centaurea solstitialis]|uniref:RING-type E3 ubiquitin transferase n=1 Tax=Centaurea solstitialis TaxID=347529 RepID=A0AA38T6U5_9ASTR|nr:hypothetical protein OSB04_021763 [Centaurea solstitialis]